MENGLSAYSVFSLMCWLVILSGELVYWRYRTLYPIRLKAPLLSVCHVTLSHMSTLRSLLEGNRLLEGVPCVLTEVL